ncbi:hypothetical protein [Halioxenophilus aromaticivorans]|uniref:Uncharacterized protein n=1 Tax=Halioxenophilus aromaticivorans TaxID=1306992 RepID=A0AAV3U8R3_9ALTE
MQLLSDVTLIALTILGGTFLILLAAVIKSGAEGAIKLWNGIGAVMGAAIGAMCTYYFAADEIEMAKVNRDQAVEQVVAAREVLADFQTEISNTNEKIVSLARSQSPNQPALDNDSIRAISRDLQAVENLSNRKAAQLQTQIDRFQKIVQTTVPN